MCEKRPNLKSPADMYLEGSDQHRGWFHSSLLASVGTRGRAPYHSVLTHGFVVDGEGRKMSKSFGNVIAPDEVIKPLRRRDPASLGCGRRLPGRHPYLRGNSFPISPKPTGGSAIPAGFSWAICMILTRQRTLVPDSQLLEIDRWILLRLQKLIARLREAYANYEFHIVFHSLHNFCAVDLSSLYLDILKDRLYTSPASSLQRRAAQTALYKILDAIVRLMATILSFTAEEVWELLPGAKKGVRQRASHPFSGGGTPISR